MLLPPTNAAFGFWHLTAPALQCDYWRGDKLHFTSLPAVIFVSATATDPTKKPKRKTTDDFEISEDGKVIIQDNEDEDHRHEPGYKRKRNLGTAHMVYKNIKR